MGIIRQDFEDVMLPRYLNYAMDVAKDRALPDARDGFKPVHKRIAFAMGELGMGYTSGYKKSARVVGDVLGKYHPHGDASVYDALVIMAQEFSTRYPIIDGYGNFGSLDGDNAAAMRYTQCKLTRYGSIMLDDIKKDTIDMKPNYDGKDLEPTVLPTLIPNLLLNGSHGIAVGLATKIPSHNMKEVYSACHYMIDQTLKGEEPDIDEVARLINAPDFATGGILMGVAGAREAYKTGKGKVIIRSKHEIDENGNIIITEIPYKVNKNSMIVAIKALMKPDVDSKGKVIKDAVFPQIKEIIDESDKDGIRIFIEIKKGESSQIVLNNLIKTDVGFEKSFSISLTALSDNNPKLLNAMEMLEEFLAHSANVVLRKAQFELDKLNARRNVLNGLIRLFNETIDDRLLLDIVIDIIRTSDTDEADMLELGFNEEQIKSIFSMRLKSLSKLGVQKTHDELEQVNAEASVKEAILGSDEGLLTEIKRRFIEIEEILGDERRTEIQAPSGSIEEEDLVKEETLIITYTNEGIIKAVEEKEYKSQKRGGRGVKATNTKEDEIIKFMFTTSSKDDLLFLTNLGRCHTLKAFRIGKSTKAAKGRSINNYLDLEIGEKIVDVINTNIKNKEHDLLFITKKGIIKRLELDQLSAKFSITRVITFKEDDMLVSAMLIKAGSNALIATKMGQTIRIDIDQEGKAVRPMGRAAAGVMGIKVQEGDEVIGMCHIRDNDKILTLTEGGLGKISKASEWSIIGRGAKGVIGHKVTSKSGPLVSLANINIEEDEIFIATEGGLIVRIENINTIRESSRSSTGVKTMNISQGDKITSISINKKALEEVEGEE